MLRIRLQKLIAFSLLQLTALICFLDIRTCEGLQPPSPAKKIVSKLTGNTGSGRSKGSSVPSMGSAFLESLKLDSNTEPKTFGFLPSQILGLATASFPVRHVIFRGDRFPQIHCISQLCFLRVVGHETGQWRFCVRLPNFTGTQGRISIHYFESGISWSNSRNLRYRLFQAERTHYTV